MSATTPWCCCCFCWLLYIYIAILHSWADSLCSCCMPCDSEWVTVTFYSTFLSIHRGGALTALSWSRRWLLPSLQRGWRNQCTSEHWAFRTQAPWPFSENSSGGTSCRPHHLWRCITYHSTSSMTVHHLWYGALPITVHHLWQCITCDGTLPVTVHHLWLCITYDGALLITVHHLWLCITYDGALPMTVHHLWQYITYDSALHLWLVHHLWQYIIYKGTSPMTVHYL